MTVKIHSEIQVCECCLLVLANGECCAEYHEVEPLSVWASDDTVHLAIGGEHSDNCTMEDRDEGCDCEDKGFSWSPCGGCDSGYGGDRYAVTVFYR